MYLALSTNSERDFEKVFNLEKRFWKKGCVWKIFIEVDISKSGKDDFLDRCNEALIILSKNILEDHLSSFTSLS